MKDIHNWEEFSYQRFVPLFEPKDGKTFGFFTKMPNKDRVNAGKRWLGSRCLIYSRYD